MEEITPYVPNDNPYQLALQSTKICNMNKADCMPVYIDLLSKTYYDAGVTMPGFDQKKQKDNLLMLAGALHEELKKFQFLRIEEVKIAFANGIRGEYGDYFGINIKTFFQWLRGFQMDAKRKTALDIIKQAAEREYRPVMNEAEAEAAYLLTLTRQFTEYKKSGNLSILFPNQVFFDFEKRGMIKLSDEQKAVVLASAKEKYLESLRIQRLNPKNKTHLTELSNAIIRLESETDLRSDREKIKSLAREQAIKSYYDSITQLVFNP